MRRPVSASGVRDRAKAYRDLRAHILAGDPLCVSCHVRLAKQVDHILPLSDGGSNDIANLQPLCPRCHTLKTRRESSRRKAGRPRITRDYSHI